MVLAIGGAGCGDNMYDGQRGYNNGRSRVDGGTCGYGGACGCVDRPYVVAVSLALASPTTVKDLRVELVRADEFPPSGSVVPPAQDSAGANGYWVATLMGSGGAPLASVVFSSAGGARNTGYHDSTSTRFALGLQPGVETLRIENWSTGQVLVDLDLRGHLQLLCIDRPCLSVCPPSGAGSDGGATQQPLDGGGGGDGRGAADAGVGDTGVDTGVVDAPAALSAPDASVD
jgi:hypothetical protein